MSHPSAVPVNVSLGARHAARLTLVGEPAWQALSAPAAWTVLAVFRRSFYCRNADGAIVCVGAPAIGAGPLNALCEPPEALEVPLSRLRPGLTAQQTAGVLWIAGWYGLALAGACVWRPAPLSPLPGPDTLASGLRSLAARCDGRIPPDALGGLVPGLSPAGDAFLGGAMVALHTLGRPELARRLTAWLLPRARRKTHAISLAHLACAANGEAAAHLHEVLAGVCSPEAPRLEAGLQRLAGIGHTSGWDALAGVAT